jgi:hypothetical protein
MQAENSLRESRSLLAIAVEGHSIHAKDKSHPTLHRTSGHRLTPASARPRSSSRHGSEQ